MKKTLSVLIIISQFIIGCGGAHKITRIGYESTRYEKTGCQIILSKELVKIEKLSKIGEINLGESGSSTNCGVEEAYRILRQEACNQNANLVYISEESMPDLWSTCYRCKASLYNVDSNELSIKYNSKNTISSENISNQASKAKTSSTLLSIVGYAAGFAIGYYIGSLLFKKK